MERVWLDQLGMSGSGKTCSGAKAASLALSTRVRRLNRHTHGYWFTHAFKKANSSSFVFFSGKQSSQAICHASLGSNKASDMWADPIIDED